jgi:ubiquinone/menaquinone biosynthesis C-methylase UbiE
MSPHAPAEDSGDRPPAPDYSRVAEAYARTRPSYPRELFTFLASLVQPRRVAWDCATGSGQAAVGLAEHFDRVIATDLSAEQLAQARVHPRVTYRLASAERSGIGGGAVDLVTVAAAIHWFDLERFFAEVRRVLRPGGVVAAWTYHVGHIEPPFDAVFGPFYHEVLAPYFAAGVELADDRYEGLELPGDSIRADPFQVSVSWNLDQTLTFVESWSGTQRYVERTGLSPIPALAGALEAMWGPPEQVHELRWPLYLRVARLSA